MKSPKGGRPKLLGEDAKTVSLKIEAELWESLEQKALAMGYKNRTQLIRAIAKGDLTVEQLTGSACPLEEEPLGE